MYAIIKTGGKQYRVAKGDMIDVELLHLDQGSAVEFNEVLFVNDGSNAHVGEPLVAGYIVKGEIIGDAAGPKITSLKYRPRGHTQKKWGHRQRYTRVKITDIDTGAKPKKAASEKEVAPKKEAAPKAAKAETEKKAKAAPKPKAIKDKD